MEIGIWTISYTTNESRNAHGIFRELSCLVV